jgi:hypothetical protein
VTKAWWQQFGFARDPGGEATRVKFKTYRPWQIRQWLGYDPAKKGDKPLAIAPSLETRQRQRAAFRALAHKQVTEQYGPEPRANRRRIALKLAKRAFQEHRKAA